MHHVKNHGIPLAILSRILAQSCVLTPLPELCRERLYTHNCASILDSIAKGITLFSTIFCMMHPIPTSPFIDFFVVRVNPAMRMRA